MRLWRVEHETVDPDAEEGGPDDLWLPRRRDARAHAARAFGGIGTLDSADEVVISRADVTKGLKGRALACALLNREGWQARGSTVEVERWALGADGKPRKFPPKKAAPGP